MKNLRYSLMLKSVLFVLFLLTLAASSISEASPWVTVYYGGWWSQQKDENVLKPDQIDYSVFTHIVYFGLRVQPDGTVDSKQDFVDSPEARQVTALAHQAGKKVLVSV